MTKAELKSIVAQLDTIGVPDTAQVKIQLLDTTRIELAAMPFLVERQDASYSVGNDGNWSPSVSEADCVAIKQI